MRRDQDDEDTDDDDDDNNDNIDIMTTRDMPVTHRDTNNFVSQAYSQEALAQKISVEIVVNLVKIKKAERLMLIILTASADGKCQVDYLQYLHI